MKTERHDVTRIERKTEMNANRRTYTFAGIKNIIRAAAWTALTKTALAAVMSILLSSMLSAPSYAQTKEDESGFYLGLKFIGSSLHAEESAEGEFFIKDDGGGVLVDIGYRFNPVFSLELALGGASHDTSDPKISAGFQSIQFFGFYRFSSERPFRPYLKGGFGGYALELNQGSLKMRIEGGGVAFGGGFRFFFTSHFSIGVDFTHNIINYEEALLTLEGFSVGTSIDEEGSMTSLGLTFSYSF
jgi:hypothetical protein